MSEHEDLIARRARWRDRMRARRAECREFGICVLCQQQDATPYRVCWDCRVKRTARRLAQREFRAKVQQQRPLGERLRAAGEMYAWLKPLLDEAAEAIEGRKDVAA